MSQANNITLISTKWLFNRIQIARKWNRNWKQKQYLAKKIAKWKKKKADNISITETISMKHTEKFHEENSDRKNGKKIFFCCFRFHLKNDNHFLCSFFSFFLFVFFSFSFFPFIFFFFESFIKIIILVFKKSH